MKKFFLFLALLFLGFTANCQNPLLLKDIFPGNNTSGTISQITKTTNYTFFNEDDDDADTNKSLFRTDGTPAGTIKLNLTSVGFLGTKVDKLTPIGDKIVFSGDNSATYGEIWISDGTQSGTIALDKTSPSVGSSAIWDITTLGSSVIYGITDNNNHTLLKKTDGTIAGTSVIYDFSNFIAPEIALSKVINNILYFNIYDSNGTGIDQLWRSDGTTAGTYMLKDFGLDQFVASWYMPANSGLFYWMIVKPGTGNVLWKSDGTIAGTESVKTIGTTGNNNYPQFVATIGNNIAFAGLDGNGKELWTTDGTAAGTNMIADINPGAANSNPSGLIFMNNHIYFSAITATSGAELWESNGDVLGTVLVKDINPGAASSSPGSFVLSNNTLFFRATTVTNGSELWITDGTAANTLIAADINPGSNSSIPNALTPGNPIYFAANNGVSGFEVFKYDTSNGFEGLHKFYVNDDSTSNDAFTTSVGNDANPGTAALPFATIQHAADVATEGSIIYVDAGIYTEQVTLNKGLSLIGAGSGVTIVLKPAVINPPPGPFTEPGTIQSSQNIGDIHIRDMSVTGDDNGVTPIVLQTGGSVKYCRLIGGNQGIFFRVDPAIKTAIIENNYIRVSYIGINCQGSGLTAILNYNTIELTNPGFAAGVFAGLDFGPLVRFTAISNSINNYNYVGFLANSYNTNITQNSILGTGQHAIEQSTNSLGFATCNWFGTTNAGTIASKVGGLFSYTPYLTNGTNSIINNGSGGFIPVAGSCGEGINNFYVNDNSRTNDVFTTAVGSNSNSGTSLAPFATLSYAISVAPANSIIHVDAGTYAEQVIIDKGIVINGAGRELTNFVKPSSALVPAPGPFTEIGLIETTQGIGDVHIRNISVNSVDGSSQNIIIQNGGSVKNCKLLNGGQGVFFRIASGNRNAEVSFNTIQPIGIGINCQGAGLTANIVNNTISKAGGYYAGIFAGLDFGFLPQITITNNKISDYFGIGILANVNISNVTNNSIVGTQQSKAIQGNALNATCNWYGTNTPAISGPVVYSPFLTNGTDNDIYNQGFQPVPGSCNGVQHQFYVNDNSNVGNVFTTAGGDDINNNGSPSAPLATIVKALTKAQAGDTIFVDAGNYTEAVTVTKDITIRGAGMGITILNGPTAHITPPAGAGESGIIQSTAGLTNVIIENMTIDGSVSDESHGTFIQGGGRISNCELRYVNDGFYFQYLSTEARTAVGNNNYVHHINYVGALFAGNGLSATATNNVIDLTGALYGIGFISGYGGNGNVESFTASNNLIINFNGFGIMVGSLQTAQIHDNSITRITGNYFENRHTVNVDATCNWYGTAVASAIITNMTGSVNYTPWLTNGTDSDLVSNGFQPLPNICNGTPVTVILDNSSNLTCKDANNGMINITVSNGLAPYNFLWTNSNNPAFNSSSEDLSNLVAGTYQLLLTDTNGSTATLSNIEISEPSLLIATADGTNNFCFGETIGTASVIASGGTAPYTYLWNNGATTDEITNLAVGTYSITVTDANGCISNASYEVTQPPLLTASITNNSTACSNNATVTAVGGTPSYTYLWSNGATTASINSMPMGTYNVTVTDNNGCSTITSITLTVGEAFNPSASVTDVSCFGGSNGTIIVTNANGTAPFTFSKDGITFLSGTFPYSFNNLSAGTYNIAVRDANGCTGFVTKTIAQPAVLTATILTVQSTCSGQSNGAISITTAGGSGALSYSWTGTGSYNSNQKNISGLATGNYFLTVTDKNGCTTSLNVYVPTYNAIVVSEAVTNVLCKGSLTGAINLTVSGGSGSGFAYSWIGGLTSTSEDISNLGASTSYNVTITDIGSGCLVTKSYTVTQPTANLSLTTGKTNATGCGGSLGTITATGSGGTSPYQYKLDNGIYQSSGVFTSLYSGNYTVWVKDANGCNTSKVIAITDSGSDQYESNNSKNQAKLITIGTLINARIALATDTADWFKFTTPAGNGNYNLNINHPTVNYTFNMYPSANNAAALVPTSSTSTSKQYALTGGTTYYVQITGALSFNCYDLSVIPVAGFAKSSSDDAKVVSINELSIKAYPNPHHGSFNLSIKSLENGRARIELFTILGQLLATRDVTIVKDQNTIVEFNDVGRGMILYHVTIGNQVVNGKVYGND